MSFQAEHLRQLDVRLDLSAKAAKATKTAEAAEAATAPTSHRETFQMARENGRRAHDAQRLLGVDQFFALVALVGV